MLEAAFGYLTCSASQHTGPVFHLGPQSSTNCFLTSSFGSFASPLSGHGSAGEKKLEPPQLPRIEHRPASCFGVKALLDTRLASSKPVYVVECQSRRILPEEAWHNVDVFPKANLK
jgi:hypothetical protein